MATVPPSPPLSDSRVVLPDSTVTLVRPVQQDDQARLLRFLERLSLRSRYFRFGSGAANLRLAARVFAAAGNQRGVVACDSLGEIVAHAEYVATAPGEAEVAVVVADRLQGLGLARHLIRSLMADAQTRGIRRFQATVLPANSRMLALFTHAFGAIVTDSPTGHAVSFPVAPSATELHAASRRASSRIPGDHAPGAGAPSDTSTATGSARRQHDRGALTAS